MTEENQAYVGFVVGLDYKNPYISPYQEFQVHLLVNYDRSFSIVLFFT